MIPSPLLLPVRIWPWQIPDMSLTEEKGERAGVMIGAGIGGLEGIEADAITLKERGPRRLGRFYSGFTD